MIFSFWVLLAFGAKMYSFQEINWCSLNCDSEVNTMCKYQENPNVNDCRGSVSTLDETGKQRLLGFHNYVREVFAYGGVEKWPSAANMRQITWDEDCSKVALRWAFQCTPGHDKCRRTPQFPVVGQNYADASNTNQFPDAIFIGFRGWEIEVITAKPSYAEKYVFGLDWGHFSALVWADTYKMGCGMVNTTQGRFKTTILVCNYAPAGNIEGKPMWLQGKPCTKCPSGSQCNTKSTYPQLCALPNDPSNEIPQPIKILAPKSMVLSPVLLGSSATFCVYWVINK